MTVACGYILCLRTLWYLELFARSGTKTDCRACPEGCSEVRLEQWLIRPQPENSDDYLDGAADSREKG